MAELQIPYSNWLKVPGGAAEPTLAYFRRRFTLDRQYGSYKLGLSADARYKLYVNGRLISAGPVKGDNKVWYSDTVDIAPYLQAGENVLAAEVLAYPLAGNYNHSVFRTGRPGLYVKDLQEDGLALDGGWRCRAEKDFSLRAESRFFSPLYILEDRRGDEDTMGWRLAGYDDSGWDAAVPYINMLEISKASVPGDLTPRPIPPLTLEPGRFTGVKSLRESSVPEDAWNGLVQRGDPVTIPAYSKHIVELDAGVELTAYLSLRTDGGKGARFRVLTSECYVLPEKSDTMEHGSKKGDRADSENGVLEGFTDTYTAAGAPGEAFEPFWFRTFRYVRLTVETGDEPITLRGFDFLRTGYPLRAESWVETSDASLGAVWDISLRSLQNCMHETYEDCPFYEQLQYAMDSRSQILFTYAVSGDDRLARKCMDDFRRSQRADGMINCSYPATGANVIPGFSVYYILMLEDHMMYFGDKEFLRGHMGCVDGILEYFRRHLDGRGLVGKNGGLNIADRYWSFIDWTPQWDKTSGAPDATLSGPITMESLLYVMGLTAAAKVNRYIGRAGMAEEYEQRAEKVRRAVNGHCRGEGGMYQDGPGVEKYSQHCQVFALLTDTVPVEEGAALLRQTLDAPEKYAQCSVAMAFYLFRALEKAGMYSRLDGCWELWRDMLRKNLTTCVENNVGQRSDCHAWGAVALYELPAVTLGVRPAAPGYEKIAVRPVPGYLTWAKGEAVTRWGKVFVEWHAGPEGIQLSYTAPQGVEVVT